MVQAPVITICVGATKAGTSWVYQQMAAHPDCEFRTIKELHYFDTLAAGSADKRIQKLRGEKALLKQRLAAASVTRQIDLQRRIADLRDWISVLSQPPANYEAYRHFLTKGRAAQAVVGDVTPAYATLPEATLRRIAEMSEDVRILYLMRDPVARMWSHVRMLALRKADDAGFERAAATIFDTCVAKDPLMEARGDYAGALTKLRAVVRQDRLLVMFSEELMTAAGMAQLWQFLGLAAVETDFSVRVFEGKPLAQTPDQRARARAALWPQYEQVALAFPTLPVAWRNSMKEVAA